MASSSPRAEPGWFGPALREQGENNAHENPTVPSAPHGAVGPTRGYRVDGTAGLRTQGGRKTSGARLLTVASQARPCRPSPRA